MGFNVPLSAPGPLELRLSLVINYQVSKRRFPTIGLVGIVTFLALGLSIAHPRVAYAKLGPYTSATAKQAAACGGGDKCPNVRGVYLGDASFRQSLIALFRASGLPKPDWFPNGYLSPVTKVIIAGKVHIAGHSWDKRSGGPRRVAILFAIDSGRMIAQYTDDDGNDTWLGSPTAEEQKALMDAETPKDD
jgi:hypothetical protein